MLLREARLNHAAGRNTTQSHRRSALVFYQHVIPEAPDEPLETAVAPAAMTTRSACAVVAARDPYRAARRAGSVSPTAGSVSFAIVADRHIGDVRPARPSGRSGTFCGQADRPKPAPRFHGGFGSGAPRSSQRGERYVAPPSTVGRDRTVDPGTGAPFDRVAPSAVMTLRASDHGRGGRAERAMSQWAPSTHRQLRCS